MCCEYGWTGPSAPDISIHCRTKVLPRYVKGTQVKWKRCWQIVKMIINKNAYMSVTKRVLHNGKMVEDGKEIADSFNDFFVNVGSTLAKAIPPVSKSPTQYIKENMVNCLYIRPVTEIEIADIISDYQRQCSWVGWAETKCNQGYQGIYKNAIAAYL